MIPRSCLLSDLVGSPRLRFYCLCATRPFASRASHPRVRLYIRMALRGRGGPLVRWSAVSPVTAAASRGSAVCRPAQAQAAGSPLRKIAYKRGQINQASSSTGSPLSVSTNSPGAPGVKVLGPVLGQQPKANQGLQQQQPYTKAFFSSCLLGSGHPCGCKPPPVLHCKNIVEQVVLPYVPETQQ